MNSSRTHSIGLIGCGTWGRNILRDLVFLEERVVVVEPDPGRARAAGEHGASEVVSHLDALPPVDGLVVATPATTHAAVVESLLELDVPIFVEKPFTTDPESARHLVDRAGDRLFVMHNWRYHPGIELLGSLARSGELGAVYGLRSVRTNWTSPRGDTDSTWTLIPHDLSIAIAVLGALPEPRCAVVEQVNGRVVGMNATLGESPWIVIEASNRYRDKRREVRLHCEEGVAVLADGETDTLEILREGGPGPGSLEPRVEHRRFDPERPLLRELRAFVTHLGGGPPPPTDAAEGLAVVRMVGRLRTLAGLDT